MISSVSTALKPELEPVNVKSIVTGTTPLIYIAAPYTNPDPVENTHHACKIADALLEAGFTPLIPHLSLLWHIVSPKPYGVWLAYDRELLKRCDVVLRVPGSSAGATQECTLADSLDIPVIRPRSNDPTDCVAAVTQFFV